jgi:hypothetical protein
MKTEDKNIEHILRGLANFRPPAKPDWEAFYNKNKKDIDASAGNWANSGLRKFASMLWNKNTLIGLGFAIGIFAGFYFFSDTSSNTQPEKHSIINNNNNVENNFTVEPKENSGATDGGDETIHKPEQDLIINEKENNPEEIPTVNAENQKKGKEEEKKEIGKTKTGSNIKTVEQSTLKQQKSAGSDIDSAAPVIIKKTVIIRDTIRVTRPGKK